MGAPACGAGSAACRAGCRVSAYLPSGRTVAKLKVEVGPGVWVSRSSGTRDRRTVQRMQEMVRELGGRGQRAWDLLGRVASREWTLMELYERYVTHAGDLAQVRAGLADVRLAALRPPFLASVRARRTEQTARHYAVYLAALEAAGFVRPADLTVGALARWVATLPGAPGTRRKYAAGVSAFCSWLVRDGVLASNPMRDVPKPSPAPPRMSFLETSDAMRLADAQPSPYRELSALLAGTGLDLSVALQLRRAQVDLDAWGIVSRRAKTGRSHTLLVAEWARPYLERACRAVVGDGALFPGVTRFAAGEQHRAACAALGIRGYWLRDARHTWAVRFARAGGSAAQGAEQLGHADGGVLFLKVYGRYVPSLAERASVERRATRQDGRARR